MRYLPRYFEELEPRHLVPDSSDYLSQDRRNSLPRLEGLIGKADVEEAKALELYMKSAPDLYSWMGNELDPLSNGTIRVSEIEYTDGEFVWREMHIHLLLKYSIQLPQSFRDHVRSFQRDFAHLTHLEVPEDHNWPTSFGRYLSEHIID